MSSAISGQVRRYSGATGAFVGIFAAGNELAFPTYLVFTPSLPSPPSSIEVAVDIKPGACPNRLNVGDRAIPVAILGTSSFDVTRIDVSTVRLNGAAPRRRGALGDVATPDLPFTGKRGARDCAAKGRDGFKDLILHFDLRDIVSGLGPIADGEVKVLRLTGALKAAFGGTHIEGEDVVVFEKKCRGVTTKKK